MANDGGPAHAIIARPAMPTVTFMTSIDCVRSAPPRNSAFQLACRNAADNTSRMERGVTKAGSFWGSVHSGDARRLGNGSALPLPEGEGWGEGLRSNDIAQPLTRIARAIRPLPMGEVKRGHGNYPCYCSNAAFRRLSWGTSGLPIGGRSVGGAWIVASSRRTLAC